MNVTICDQKNCGSVIKEEIIDRDFELMTEEGTLTITLTEAQDFCPACARKEKAKLAIAAWNALKQKREVQNAK